MAKLTQANWLIWRLNCEKDAPASLQAGAQRFQERFGTTPNRASVSAKAPQALVEAARGLIETVQVSGYIFNPNEVFIGRVESSDG